MYTKYGIKYEVILNSSQPTPPKSGSSTAAVHPKFNEPYSHLIQFLIIQNRKKPTSVKLTRTYQTRVFF
jgi:hypothetical protein